MRIIQNKKPRPCGTGLHEPSNSIVAPAPLGRQEFYMEEQKAVALAEIKAAIETQLMDPEILKTLLVTTFKGLDAMNAKAALLEGMMRGFAFKDFLVKDIYAVPFSSGYSLVTSIAHARKIGMRSGVVGKSAPSYEEKDGKIISCTITIKRSVSSYIGDFTETVYFSEYNTGKNQWATKPRTMIAKVAEMHALRMACPEELSQSYLEEEYEKDVEKPKLVIENHATKLEGTKSLEELKAVWANIPGEARIELEPLKKSLKAKYENPQV